jgi:hypothetical protein
MKQYSNLKIIGMHGICKGERDEIDLPDELELSGYITNQGCLYCIKEKNTKCAGLFPSDLYTKKELKTYIQKWKRKQKLLKIENTFFI